MTTRSQKNNWYQRNKVTICAKQRKIYKETKKDRFCAEIGCRRKIKSYMQSDTIHCEICGINRIRKLADRPPLVVHIRKCLKCDKKFKSMGNWNRVCDYCNIQNREASYGVMSEHGPEEY